jgi:hypothetical protein
LKNSFYSLFMSRYHTTLLLPLYFSALLCSVASTISIDSSTQLRVAGAARIQNGAIILTEAQPSQSGLVFLSQKVQAHISFNTTFIWSASNCASAIGEG